MGDDVGWFDIVAHNLGITVGKVPTVASWLQRACAFRK
jgi:hypothetical protein